MTDAEPSPEVLEEWSQWVEQRPEAVRVVARRLKPWLLYTLKPNGQRVFVLRLDEHLDGKVTCRVAVRREFNPNALFDRDVFGIDPDDLVEEEQ